MMKKMNLYLSLIMLLTGCAGGVELTKGAKLVKNLPLGGAVNCELLAIEDISYTVGAHPAACARSAHDTMMNRVAELGGNAVIVTNKVIAPCLLGGTTINFEAYKCP